MLAGGTKLPSGWQLYNGYLVGEGANLTSADLTGIDLQGANLPATSFGDANLTRADLSNAILTGSGFYGSNLTNADLHGATVTVLDFVADIWSNTTCLDGSNSYDHVNGGMSNFVAPMTVEVGGSSSSTIPSGSQVILTESGLPAGVIGTLTFFSPAGTQICTTANPTSGCLSSASLPVGNHPGIFGRFWELGAVTSCRLQTRST